MSNGVDRRERIDTETVRALLIVNGGGAVALLALLPRFLGKDHHNLTLATAILCGVLVLMLGLASAVVHNHLRRRCSLEHDRVGGPRRRTFLWRLHMPMVCFFSYVFWSYRLFSSGIFPLQCRINDHVRRRSPAGDRSRRGHAGSPRDGSRRLARRRRRLGRDGRPGYPPGEGRPRARRGFDAGYDAPVRIRAAMEG